MDANKRITGRTIPQQKGVAQFIYCALSLGVGYLSALDGNLEDNILRKAEFWLLQK